MSSSTAAIKWILDHAKELNLSVESYNWGVSFEKPIYDCEVQITVNKSIYEGRGSAESEELALLKGFSESLDRMAFSESAASSTTNGIAVHTSQEKATQNAKYEIIERDRFFCHFLTRTPFFETDLKIDQLGFSSDVFSLLHSQGLNFQLAEMAPYEELRCFIFMGHGLSASPRKGFMFGMGCSQVPKQAARSAVLEGLRHFISSINSSHINSITETEFLERLNWGPYDHSTLSSNIDYAQKIASSFFPLNPMSFLKSTHTKSHDITIEVLPMQGIFYDSPFFAAKASSNKTQDIYFGPTAIECLNLDRLSEFSGEKCTWETINKLIHPLA